MMPQHTRYCISTRTRKIYFDSLLDAREAANDYFRRTKIVLGIVAVPKQYRLSEAIEMAKQCGFTRVSIGKDDIAANPMVYAEQDFWPKGDEVIRFRRARGKYRGHKVCGVALRPGGNY